MKVLNLTLKRNWFDLIEALVKIHEYREIKEYWVVRLFEVVKPLKIENCSVYYTDIKAMFNFR